jgi:hypothetical protein
MATTDREILERLFREGGIKVVRGVVFDRVPPLLRAESDFAKVEGMMLGLAVGDGGWQRCSPTTTRVRWRPA